MPATAIRPRPVKLPKPAYKPHIEKVSDTEYTINSETYIYPIYSVTVADGEAVACECTGNAKFGTHCKHLRWVQYVLDYHKAPTHMRPVDIGYGRPGPVASPAMINPHRGSAAGLLEAFGA